MSISLAILVSGRGSNMKAILDAIKSGDLDAMVEVVISNNADAPALKIAADYGVRSVSIPNKGHSRQEHEEKVLLELRKVKVDYIVLAGYMRLLSQNFLEEFKDKAGYCRIINIHPSLLPAFPGACAYEDAFNYGVRTSGITIHLIDELMDHGPILAQESFVRLPEDSLEQFKARGLAVEHRLLPRVLQSIAQAGVKLLPTTAEKMKSAQEALK